jgi:hypothetical protein
MLVSLQSLANAAQDQPAHAPAASPHSSAPLATHPAWEAGTGLKHQVNNLRLLLVPYVYAYLLLSWLALVPPALTHTVQTGLAALGSLVNTSRPALPTWQMSD